MNIPSECRTRSIESNYGIDDSAPKPDEIFWGDWSILQLPIKSATMLC
jgi:hypothetical protein